MEFGVRSESNKGTHERKPEDLECEAAKATRGADPAVLGVGTAATPHGLPRRLRRQAWIGVH